MMNLKKIDGSELSTGIITEWDLNGLEIAKEKLDSLNI